MVVTENRPVTMTEGAIKQIKSLIAQEGFDTTQKLRVGVKGGGCSGMSYILGFDHPTEKDKSCLLYTSPSPRDGLLSRMPSSA